MQAQKAESTTRSAVSNAYQNHEMAFHCGVACRAAHAILNELPDRVGAGGLSGRPGGCRAGFPHG